MSSRVEKRRLNNGLMLIGEINPAHQSCAMGYFVRTGARDEMPAESGLSHFLEHMMFKATSKRTAIEVNLQLGNIGAQANAFTSDESTVYYSTIIPEYFDDLQELLSDMLRPALLDEDFETEKKVILEEIALYQDRPHFYLYENATRDFFGAHPLANSVLGSTDSISAMTAGQMRDYFKRRYTPANMVLAACGNFSWEKFADNAEKLTASWEGSPAARVYPEAGAFPAGRVFTRKNLSQSHLLFLSPSCAAMDAERHALSILATIVGDVTGSKFFWQLIDSGLAESASADLDEKDGCGVFMAFASTSPDKVEEVSGIVRKIIAEALDFSDADLERAKAKVISRVILNGELPMGRLMALGMEWNYRGRIHSLQAELDAYRAVGRKEIEKSLEKFPLKPSEYRLLPE